MPLNINKQTEIVEDIDVFNEDTFKEELDGMLFSLLSNSKIDVDKYLNIIKEGGITDIYNYDHDYKIY